jgi:hypothetical protein
MSTRFDIYDFIVNRAEITYQNENFNRDGKQFQKTS